MPGVARTGDVSSHGGVLALPFAKSVLTNDRWTAHTGTMHVCPIKGHGITPIVSPVMVVLVEDKPIATVGSVAGCTAVVVTGSGDVEAS